MEMEIKEAVLKPIKFKYFKITPELLANLKKDTEKANHQDTPNENPVHVWLVNKKYHGLCWNDCFEYYFLENYETRIQKEADNIFAGDYIVESDNGHTKLISHDDFQHYFKEI